VIGRQSGLMIVTARRMSGKFYEMAQIATAFLHFTVPIANQFSKVVTDFQRLRQF